MKSYADTISSLCKALSESARKRYKIELAFDEEHKIGRPPSYANSEFLTNRAMGDWAESLLQRSLSGAIPDSQVVKYGNSDQIVAGHPDFGKFYLAYQQELKETGKRPDILVFRRENHRKEWGNDISSYDRQSLEPIAKTAVAAIEVRSSKILAEKYIAMRKEQERKSARQAPSFTTKLEDLRIVCRWILSHGVQHFYVQIFLDSAYIIPFRRILEIIERGPKDVKLERNTRNQNKPTFHIPITYGDRVGLFAEQPEFTVEILEKNARIEPFIRPVGGVLKIDRELLIEVLGFGA